MGKQANIYDLGKQSAWRRNLGIDKFGSGNEVVRAALGKEFFGFKARLAAGFQARW